MCVDLSWTRQIGSGMSLRADDLTSAGLQALREEVSTVRCKVRPFTLL